jgi:PadR family transcriptional regulator PadR
MSVPQRSGKRRPPTHLPMTSHLRGTLDVLVLQALARGARYGYAIVSWLRASSDRVIEVRQGSLYPALHRLERQELVVSRWSRSHLGRSARVYTLTPRGRRTLKVEIARLQAIVATLRLEER